MSNEYSIIAAVDSSGAVTGAREFKRSLADIIQSASKMVKETDRVRAGFRQLGDRASGTGAVISRDFRSTAQSITNSAARIEAQATKSSTALESFSRSAATSTQRLAREYQSLPRSITATSRAIEVENRRVIGSFNGVGNAVGALKGILAGAVAGFTMQAAIGQITDFETAMGRLKGLLGDGMDKELAQLSATARELGATTVFSAGEAAQAMIELTKAGFSAQQTMTASKDVMLLAAAEQMGLAEAAEITAITLAQFGLAADQAGRVTNVMAKLSVSAMTDVRQMAEGMKYAGVIASQLGVSVEDTAAALAVLSDAGMQSSQAGTGLRTMLDRLLTPTDKAKAVFSQLGLTFDQVKKTLGGPDGFQKTIELLSQRFGGVKDPVERSAMAFQLFGTEGAAAAQALMSMSGNLARYGEEAKNAAGTTERMANAVNDTLLGAWKELQSATEELVIQLGESGVRGVLRGTLDTIGAFARGLAGLSEDTDKASAYMQKFNDVGQFLRNNIEVLSDVLVILIAVAGSRYVAAMMASTAATLKDAWAKAALATQNRLAATTAVGLGVAARTATTAQIAATAAATGLRAALAALGGPIGLIITGLGLAAAALFTFKNNSDAAKVSADDLSGSLERLKGKYLAANAEHRELLKLQTIKVANDSSQRVRDLQNEIAAAEKANTNYARLQETLKGNASDAAAFRLADAAKGVVGTDKLLALKTELAEVKQVGNEATLTIAQMEAGTFGVQEAVKTTTPALQDYSTAVTDTKDATKEAEKAQREAEKALNDFKNAAIGAYDSVTPLHKLTTDYNQQMATLRRLASMSAADIAKLGVEFEGLTHADITAAMSRVTEEFEKQKLAMDPVVKKYEDVVKGMRDTAKELRPLDALEKEHNSTLWRYYELLALSDVELAKLKTTRGEVAQAIADENTQYDANLRKVRENAEQSDVWSTAWKRAIERVDDAFVNLWKSAFSGTNDFIDGVKSAFKDLMAELMHAKFTKPISNWLSGMLGGGQGGSGNMLGGLMDMFKGGGSGNGLMSGLMNGFKGLFSGQGFSGFSGMGNSLSGLFGNGMASTMQGFTSAMSSFTSMFSSGAAATWGSAYGAGSSALAAGGGVLAPGAGGGALAGGAGAAGGGAAGVAAVPIVGWIIAGMMANAALFDKGWQPDGQRNDMTKSMVQGGMKAAGPLGAMMGLTMAAPLGVDKLLQNIGLNAKVASILSGSAVVTRLFGHKKPELKEQGIMDAALSLDGFSGTAYQNIVAKGGVFRSDKKWTNKQEVSSDLQRAMLSATSDVRLMVKDIAKGLTGADKDALTGLKVTGEKLVLDKKDPEKAKQQLEEYAERMRQDLAKAALKALDFGYLLDDADSQLDAPGLLGLVKSMQDLLALNPHTEGLKAYTDSQKSQLEMYRQQRTEFAGTVAAYDGTVASLQKLVEATGALKQSQMELVFAYQQVRDEVKKMLGDTKQSIRESLMTPDQLYGTRQTQIQDLMAQMRTETDPTKLQNMAGQINQYVNDAYGMLDDDQKAAMAPGFLTFLDEVEALMMDRIGTGLSEVEGDASGTNAQVNAKLEEVANKQMAAATTFSDAVDRFAGNTGGGGMAAVMARRVASEIMTV